MVPQSVNCLLETLLEERWVALEASEKERKKEAYGEGATGQGLNGGNFSTVVAHSMDAINTQTIYEGNVMKTRTLSLTRSWPLGAAMPGDVKAASFGLQQEVGTRIERRALDEDW